MQARFLGRSLYEATTVPVPRQIERVQVEAVAGFQTQRDFEPVAPERLFETAHTVFAAVSVKTQCSPCARSIGAAGGFGTGVFL